MDKKKSRSGLVPPGDVRLTANIRADLHARLKDASEHYKAVTGKSYTIGEMIEDMIEDKLHRFPVAEKKWSKELWIGLAFIFATVAMSLVVAIHG